MHVFIYAKYNFLFFPFEFGVKYELNMFLTDFVRTRNCTHSILVCVLLHERIYVWLETWRVRYNILGNNEYFYRVLNTDTEVQTELCYSIKAQGLYAHKGPSKGHSLKTTYITLSDVFSKQHGHYTLTETLSLKSFLHMDITSTVKHKDKICKIAVKYYLWQ